MNAGTQASRGAVARVGGAIGVGVERLGSTVRAVAGLASTSASGMQSLAHGTGRVLIGASAVAGGVGRVVDGAGDALGSIIASSGVLVSTAGSMVQMGADVVAGALARAGRALRSSSERPGQKPLQRVSVT